MEEVKGLKIKDILDCYNRHLGSVPTFRIAFYREGEDTVHYLYIKPEELDAFRATLNPDVETLDWNMAIFDVEKKTIQGEKYMTKEVIITFEVYEDE